MPVEPPQDVDTAPESWVQRLVASFRAWRSARRDRIASRMGMLDTPHDPLDRTLRLDLPSAEPAFPFLATFTVHFSGRRNSALAAHLLTAAKGDVSRRARQVASALPVTAVDQCRAEMELAVAERRRAGQTGVVAWAHCDGLEVDPEHEHAVADRQRALRRALVRDWRWEDEDHEITRRIELLNDPLRATAWWLLGNGNDVDRLSAAANEFCRVRELLAAASSAPAAGTATVGALVDEFCTRGTLGESDLTRVLETIFTRQGSPDLAARLHQRDEPEP